MNQNWGILSFSAAIEPASIDNLLGVAFEMVNKGATGLYLLFSSPGGSIDIAIAAYHTLCGLQVDPTTHNVGNVDSAANVLFLAGDF